MREAGGKFGEMAEAREEQYFRKMVSTVLLNSAILSISASDAIGQPEEGH